MRLWVLGSGSSGNAAVIEHADRYLMIDAGFELPELVVRLRAADIPPALVDDVVLTHGHRDHVIGAADGARIYGWRVWGTLGTVWQWRALRDVDVRPFEPGDSFEVGPFTVRTVPTQHNIADSAAIVVDAPDTGARVAYCTDLGRITPALRRAFAGVDVLVIEANYDVHMLRNGPYPPDLQARVAGPFGHLNNQQTARLVRAVAHPGLTHVILAHISTTNNTPELAVRAVRAALRDTPFRGEALAAPRHQVLGPIEVRPVAGGDGRPGADATSPASRPEPPRPLAPSRPSA
jgi:phosphoribosyl 1,2-cyclic phosphodiesterase